MQNGTWLGFRAAIAALVFITVSGCSTAGSQSPELMARCTKLYMLWGRYEHNLVLHHTGQRAQAELALYDCENGRFDAGITELERVLRRGLIPIPPA